MTPVTKEDFESWIKNPVTKKLFEKIKVDVDYMKTLLVNAGFSDIKEIQGRIKACQLLLELEYEDLFTDE